MVLSTAKQLDSTYLVWRRFTYPDENGGRDAIAVPKAVGDTLNPAYAIIIEMAVVHFWSIFFGLILFIYIRRKNAKNEELNPLAPKLWNKRTDLLDLVIDRIGSLSKECPSPFLVLLLFLCLAGWVGQKAIAIVVPPLIIISNAAPVNPEAIYVPDTSNIDDSASEYADLFALEAPRYLRALGSTSIGEELRSKVDISTPVPMGQTSNGESIQRINYGYSVTGADMGLQYFPDLNLKVVGSCVTEYGWYNRTDNLDVNGNPINVDFYNVWNNLTVEPFSSSLYDGRQPSATFFAGNNSIQGTLPTSNATWAVVVSAVDRLSFSTSTDPWYLTDATPPGTTDAQYVVRPRRPALSCWQDDVWSYKGHNSTVETLETIPGLDLSEKFHEILSSILGFPTIQLAGQHLQASALVSSTTANQQLFDAGASSIYNDLERLVETAYVATINCLTDLTLYQAGANNRLNNIALAPSGQPADGVADFVVWTPDVAALSTPIVIAIPSVFVGLWILSIWLLYWTPVKKVTDLDWGQTPPKKKPTESTEPGENQSGENQPGPGSNTASPSVDEKQQPISNV